MQSIDRIREIADRGGLSFLIIGGHAVVIHGYARTTYDLDLLIRKADREKWLSGLQEAGFTVFHDGGNFLQFRPPPDFVWPVDLMLVNETTFEGMLAEAKDFVFHNTRVFVPSLRHLLALKFHALKQAPPHRVLKDMYDVLMLIESNRLDVKDDSFRALVLKYGNDELYEKILRGCG